VQGLKQEGNCESRVLSFSTLITNSKLGELSFVLENFRICMMVLCVCLLNCNRSVVNSCMCDQSNHLAGWFYIAKPFYALYVLGMRVFGMEWLWKPKSCVLLAYLDIMHDSDVCLPLHCLGND